MSDDIDNLTDALIEDTVHCCTCGVGCTLGGDEYTMLCIPDWPGATGCSGIFCVTCAANIHAAYEELLREMGEDAT